MKLKKKRKWVWCSKEQIPFNLEHVKGLHTMGHRRRDIKVPSKITCPFCKKRFKPRLRSCGDEGCWHLYLPPHKKLE
jgi:hypothetical protein